MCIGQTRLLRPGQGTSHLASRFASATVIAGLGVDDWQVSQDAAALADELVGKVAEQPAEVTVVLHRESVEVIVAGSGTYERGEVYPRVPFTSEVDCDLP